MRILIAGSATAINRVTAGIVSGRVARNPRLVLGLATGATPEGLYAGLVDRVRQGHLDLSKVTTFNLDEYLGLDADHPASYHQYMERHLFGQVPAGRHHLPDGAAPDPVAECRRYEVTIAAAGGIDLQLLGIGRNGHIGFNEPCSPFGSRTRVVELSQDTIAANSRFFATVDEVPRRAISMGIRTIMRARSVLLIASGAKKAPSVAAAVQGPVTEAVPASVLQLHPAATLVIDRAAAALLRRPASGAGGGS